MSLRRGRIGVLFPVAALAAALLAGCGYQPIYGSAGGIGGETVAAELAQTKVAVIANREGQMLRNLLIESLNPEGRPEQPAYTLNVSLSESRQELGIRKDDTATRANLIVSAHYNLSSQAGQPVTSGSVRTITSYNILLDEFATLSAERNARERALRQISEDIRTRLALHFQRED